MPNETTENPINKTVEKVAEKVKSCENILVALSKDPSVDEISAAIGLTMILNKIGKHVTAIYSGETPNALEFLKPDETFEKNTNSLQDFIIALNKDKADHLRYKIEGDFVKVYITPYKTTITDKDLEFSQGDFNVDLVVAIDVESGEAIDAALSEYGRIMHDATAINITTNAAGRFAELEWSDPSMSSVCEMIAILAERLGLEEFDQATATALLTGIVASTDRFSNARTTSETMALSSKLMQAGADQQLISSNIMQPEPEPTPAPAPTPKPVVPTTPVASTTPKPIAPAPKPATVAPTVPVQPTPAPKPVAPAPKPVAATPKPATPAAPAQPTLAQNPLIPAPTLPTPQPTPAPTSTSTAPIPNPVLVGTPSSTAKKPAPSLEPAGAEGLEAPSTPIKTEPIQKAPSPVTSDTMRLPGQFSQDDIQATMNAILNPPSPVSAAEDKTEKMPEIISSQGNVMAQNVAEPVPEEPDYGSMIDQALSEANRPLANPALAAAPEVPSQVPEASTIPSVQYPSAATTPAPAPSTPAPNPTTPPTVPPIPAPAPSTPAPQPIEVPNSDVNIELPPPPAPNIDTNSFQIPKAE